MTQRKGSNEFAAHDTLFKESAEKRRGEVEEQEEQEEQEKKKDACLFFTPYMSNLLLADQENPKQ